MALDATVGGATSNSYVTVAEADDYFADRAHAESWDDVENKESLLITSTSMLDWYMKWKGTKATDSQALDWPRLDVSRPDGTVVDSTTIPRDVKQATFELAFLSIDSDRLAENPLDGFVQIQASSLMLKTDNPDVNSTKPKPVPSSIKTILNELIVPSGSVVRLMRA